MSKIECHSSTNKDEILIFIDKHKSKKIEIHYECNSLDTWGNDDFCTYDTVLDDEYKELLQMVETHYIHNIETK